jgi:hypothetical protein
VTTKESSEKRTGTTPGVAEQRFPGYDVLAQSKNWDRVTRTIVFERLTERTPLRFFSDAHEPVARALLDRLLAQNDEPRVPVIEMIDHRLADRRGDGYRYQEMPEDWEAWPRSIEAIDQDARDRFEKSFAHIEIADQMKLVERVRLCKGEWHGMAANRVFELWMRYACDAYYSHPWAWNEIGFGGPAYPRGYKNLGVGRQEPWEVKERDASDPVPWADRVDAARAEHISPPDEPAVRAEV